MKRFAMIPALMSASMMAQVVVPEGTAIRVRLDNHLSSATAQKGQMVDFVVVEEVRVGDTVVIESGAKASGTIIVAESKKNMGRAGKLDFSVDKVRTVDNRYLEVRPTQQGSQGKGSTVKTGLITAGVAVLFWPAAPFVLLHKGKEAEVARGAVYTVYSDATHTVKVASAAASVPSSTADKTSAAAGHEEVRATIQVEADSAGAEIEVDGKFVGNTPATLKLAPGLHLLSVRDGSMVWMREVDLPQGVSSKIKARLAPEGPPKVLTGAKLH